jgi:hypothetical protein
VPKHSPLVGHSIQTGLNSLYCLNTVQWFWTFDPSNNKWTDSLICLHLGVDAKLGDVSPPTPRKDNRRGWMSSCTQATLSTPWGGCGSKHGAPTPMVQFDILGGTGSGFEDPVWGDLFSLNRRAVKGHNRLPFVCRGKRPKDKLPQR